MDLVLEELETEPPDAIRDRLASAGITPGPASLPVEFRLDEDRFQHDLTRLPALASLAAEVGVRTMFRSIPASSSTPAAELLPVLQRRVSTLASVLAQYGIDFAVEAIGPLHRRREAAHEFIWRLPDAAEFATSCDGDVGVLVDSWHWHHSHATAKQIGELGALIRHVHIADAAPMPEADVRDDQRVLPGEGIIDLNSFRDALHTAGYTRFISPEIRGYRTHTGALNAARAALTAVRSAAGSQHVRVNRR